MSPFATVADPATDRVLARLRTYVEQESPSGDVERCTRLAAIVADDLAALDAQVTRYDAPAQGQHVLAQLPGHP